MASLARVALLGISILTAVIGCTPAPNERAIEDRLAASAMGLQYMEIQTSVFRLMSYARFQLGTPALRVYIEGDGHAWLSPNEPSTDPTPWTPISMELAMRDPAPSVAYLARPCQFIAPGSDPHCRVDFWTDRRYAEPVIESTNEAIDRLKADSGARVIELVGFSGGGAVAALVAARRHDVVNLRTVAANLDTEVWTGRHGDSPLTGSLNPADFADKLTKLPQIHFVGAEDEVVRLPVARAYRSRFAEPKCVELSVVQGADHLNGWRSQWGSLLERPVVCVPAHQTLADQR